MTKYLLFKIKRMRYYKNVKWLSTDDSEVPFLVRCRITFIINHLLLKTQFENI